MQRAGFPSAGNGRNKTPCRFDMAIPATAVPSSKRVIECSPYRSIHAESRWVSTLLSLMAFAMPVARLSQHCLFGPTNGTISDRYPTLGDHLEQSGCLLLFATLLSRDFPLEPEHDGFTWLPLSLHVGYRWRRSSIPRRSSSRIGCCQWPACWRGVWRCLALRPFIHAFAQCTHAWQCRLCCRGATCAGSGLCKQFNPRARFPALAIATILLPQTLWLRFGPAHHRHRRFATSWFPGMARNGDNPAHALIKAGS